MTSDAIERGYVLVEEDRITEVGAGDPPWREEERPDAPAASGSLTMIDARGGIIMPGMVNAHTHIAMALFRSLADDRADRLRKVLFPLESRAVDERLVYHASLHALVELILAGVTTFADMYYFEQECARATREAGVRAILGETVLGGVAPDAAGAYGGIEYAKDFADRWGDDALITPAIAPHAPYTVADHAMRRCAALAEELDIPMMLHLAEMPFEVAEIRSKHGVSPVRHMADLGILGSRLLAAHCVFTDRADHELLRSSDTGVAHNLVANMKSGKGFAPLPDMLKAGLRIGLGTDGPMSGNTLDLFGQMRAVATVHKAVVGDPTFLPARAVVELATIGGARALHMEERIGSLEVDKQADIVVVSTDTPALHPVHDPWSVVAYGAGPADVDTTIVAGRVLMHRREIPHLDREAIAARSREFGARVARFLTGL